MKTHPLNRIIPILAWLFFFQIQFLSASNFGVYEFASDKDFPEAADKGAIQSLCGENEEELAAYFAYKNMPFDPELVVTRGEQKCHIWYEPTIPGFRGDPEDSPVQGLMFDVHTLSFLSQRTEVIGDTLDIVREMLPAIQRPVEVTLGVNYALEEQWYQEAIKLNFEDLRHPVKFHETTAKVSNPWTQDYVKSGNVGGKRVVLVPRRLMEGSSAYGEDFRGFLDELVEGTFVRSRLSWEGGDIQFLRDPRNPAETIMFYGSSAKQYWGKALTDKEYAYVLKLEFGADHAVNLSGLEPHIDYFVSFIPKENIALVSVPVTNNQDLAISALELLGERLKSPYTHEVLDLAVNLSVSADEFSKNRKDIREAMDQLKKSQDSFPIEGKIPMKERMESYIRQNCSEDEDACYSGENWRKMGTKDLLLLRDWISSATLLQSDVAQIPALLSVIESQLPDYKVSDLELREQKIAELEALGLKVIRVPRIAGDRSLQISWSGISYVNNLLVDDTLFIPVMGLKKFEESVIDGLKDQLPSRYRVVPVYSRFLLLNNGGLHCATGIIRGK